MKTILRALLEVIEVKTQWRSKELKDLILNLLADTEKDIRVTPRIEYKADGRKRVAFTHYQLDDLMRQAYEGTPYALMFDYINKLYEE